MQLFTLETPETRKSLNRVKKDCFACGDNSYTMDCFRDIKASLGPSLDLRKGNYLSTQNEFCSNQ